MTRLTAPQRLAIERIGRDYLHYHQSTGGGRSELDRFKRTIVHPATLNWLRREGLVTVGPGRTLLSLTEDGRALYQEITGREARH